MQEYHQLVREAIFLKELRDWDEREGAELQALGCRRVECGGKLDRAFYPRALRGHELEINQLSRRRVSYCCRRCRRRHTPVSVRFLSYKSYSHISVLMTLVLYSGRSPEVTLRKIRTVSGASEVTVRRWRTWIAEFLNTREWKALRAKLSPLFEVARFPASLVELFQLGGGSLAETLVATLRFLKVLSRTPHQNAFCSTDLHSTK